MYLAVFAKLVENATGHAEQSEQRGMRKNLDQRRARPRNRRLGGQRIALARELATNEMRHRPRTLRRR
jgi:hypothetical protein